MKIFSKKAIILFSFLLAVFISLILPLYIWFGKTGQDTKVLDKNYSLLNKTEILHKLDIDFPLTDTIILKYEDRLFELNTASISAQIDKDKISSHLLYRRLNKGFFNYFIAFLKPKNFNLYYSYNQEKLEKFLDKISYQINKPYIPSELLINKNKKIEIQMGELGREVDKDILRKEIDSLLSFYEVDKTINIPASTIGALPDQESIQQSIFKSQKIIGKSIKLISPVENIVLEDTDIISWIDFDFYCRTDRVKEYIESLNESFKKEPISAIFKFENDQVLEFQPAKKGQEIDTEKLQQLICRRLNNMFNFTDTILEIELPIIYIEPEINNSEVNNLGIKELLGSGVSTFSHSSTIRNYNVERGAQTINHILIPPGETFSFIESLGEVSLSTGFKKAYVILGGRTTLGVGGGICQVSTTLFRAIINSGLNLTARQSHAYRVSYYEEDSEPGFDATVYIPKPDLKFVNDTDSHVLIQSTYDGITKKLAYDIYGTSDGREVKIENYRQWATAPPPPAKYVDDPSLPPGKIIQVEQRVPGLKTAFDWIVTRGDEILHQQTITSNYVPWGAVYRRGPQ
jgi:vancomycin resistance protein YoaR